MTPEMTEKMTTVIAPLADIVRDNYTKALLLRCNVWLHKAMDNGAEREDLNEVLVQAVETSTPIVNRFFKELGAYDDAQKILERQ